MQLQNQQNATFLPFPTIQRPTLKRRHPLSNHTRGDLKKSKIISMDSPPRIEIEQPKFEVKIEEGMEEEKKYEIEFANIPPKMKSFLPIMQKMAKEMNCELLYNTDPRDNEIAIVSGHPLDVQILVQLLEAMKDCETLKKVSVLFFQEYTQRISEAFTELNLVVHFGKTSFYIAGQRQDIAKFDMDLATLEVNLDRFFYPQFSKYWDFDLVDDICSIPIVPHSQEFQQIYDRFHVSMDKRRFKVVNLQRIQNKHLVSDYVYHIRKAIELNPINSRSRMLLFHGTRKTEPKTIYETNDVGFDLQYSNNGKYGRGLYFAVNAKYCHFGGYSYKTPQNTYKLLIVDVYIGNNMQCEPGAYRKAPPGFDSIYTKENFYVIYHNSRSYPVYELEYEEVNQIVL